MQYSDQSYNLRIDLDTENCELTAEQIGSLERALSPLREPVKNFPVADLHVTIEYKAPSHDYRVKTVLQLPGRGLATGDVDEDMYVAYRRCVRKLVHKVSAYKERMEDAEELAKHEKGTRHDVVAQQAIDGDALAQAVDESDYVQFRELLFPFEEPVRSRIGRWVQRYPEIEAQIGERYELADMVEEVFLNAFERYEDRPKEVPFGDWLENLIDPSVKLLSEGGAQEVEDISFVRSAVDAQTRKD